MVSVTNNGDGSYNMTVDAEIETFTDAGGVFLSNDGGATWQAIAASGTDFDRIIVAEDITDRTDCNAWKITSFTGATFAGGGTIPDSTGVIT